MVVAVAVVTARFLLPLLIPRVPVPAIVACLVLDAADQTIFQTFTDLDLDGYQTYDKALDIHYLTIAYLSTIRNWGGGPDFDVGRALWYYRLVGVALFEFTQARWLLLVFPNTFEYYFIAIEAYKVSRNPNALSGRTVVMVAATIWVVVKLPQEWWIHVAQLDVTEFVSDHFSTLGLTAAVVAAAVLGIAAGRAATRRLPPRDWHATLDADGQGLEIGWHPPRKEARAQARFDWRFVEKVVLVTLVTVIFARILPGVEGSLLPMLWLVTFVIAVNTLLSQFLFRRGVSWRSSLTEFAAMLAANVATILLYAAIVGDGPQPTPLGTVLFLVGLLTLIVVLYDRFQGIAAEQSELDATGRVPARGTWWMPTTS